MKTNTVFLSKQLTIILLLIVSLNSNAQWNIDWTNFNGTTLSGNILSKSSTTVIFDSYAESKNKLNTCQDGWAEVTVQTLYPSGTPSGAYSCDSKIIGFTPNGITSAYDVEYGFVIDNFSGVGPCPYLRIYEGLTRMMIIDFSSLSRPNPNYVYTTDVLKVERIGNKIRYYINGQLVTYDDDLTSGVHWVTETTISTPSTDWTFSASFQKYTGAISNGKASFSDKAACIVERDWLGAGTGSMYHSFLNDNIGIGTKTPARKLDINGDLRIGIINQNNSLDKLLVADPSNGDVYYRDASDFIQGGSGANDYLTKWTGSNTIGSSLLRDDGQTVSLGNYGTSPYQYFLHVYGSNWGSKNIGMDVELFNSTFGNESKAFVGNVQNNTTNTGLDIYTANGNNTNGSRFVSQNGSITNNAGYFEAGGSSATSATNYGIYAKITSGNSTSYAGYFEGSTANNCAFFNGGINGTTGTTFISDIKFKENIIPFNNALDKIMLLTPSTYTFKNKESFPTLNFPSGLQYGFIAQELEKVIPEAVNEGVTPVKYDEKGKKIADGVPFKGVNYISLIPVLTAGIKEQQIIIEKQNQKIGSLEKEILDVKALLQNSNGQLNNNNASDKIGVGNILYQNNPNPFNNVTEIKFFITETTENASILIFDMNGRELKKIKIDHKGNGSVTLSSTQLPAGMYFYSLIADNKEVDTKKMILTEY